MKVFHDGLPEWKKSGNTVVSSVQYLKENMDKDIPIVVVDVRPADEALKGHIPQAVSVPAVELPGAKDRFPADKKAPIVIYCANAAEAADACKVVRRWGYGNATVLEGGFEAWKKAGNPTSSGEMKKTVVYVPKPRPGEIPVEEFKVVAETIPADKFILDIRDEDEAMQGMLRGAKNIPTQELSSRLSEVPKDKEIITHCTTGVRAEMAYYILRDSGYKTRFLNANIKIDKDGKYEISKE